MLKLVDLSVGYGEKTILHDVSLDFPSRKLTVIIGPNGSGKTTLLKAALGLLPPMAGDVFLDERPIGTLERTEIARRVSYLAQSKSTPDMTVRQAVLHGRFPYLSYPRRYSAKDREVAAAAMEKMGISHYADTPLSALSGGERQNAYIAMALAQDTETLLLDEPTTYLDARNAYTLLKALKARAEEGRAVALVMHDLPLAFTLADRIALFAEGRMIACDEPMALLSSNAVERVFGIPLAYSEEAGYYYRY